MTSTNIRPPLNSSITENDFRNFYWLKAELLHFCRIEGISTLGNKQDLAERIALFLRTGSKQKPTVLVRQPAVKYPSLTLNTIVTKDFACTREVRNFFEDQVGPHFTFSVPLQKYIKQYPGITFADIITEYHRQNERKKAGVHFTGIDPQFEFNIFTRAFFADPKNRGKSQSDCITAWNVHKAKPKN